MTPELWTRCPHSYETTRPSGEAAWWCECHGFDCFSSVPFDEAVERMTYAVPNVLTFKAPEILRPWCARMLLAALGEDTE